MGPRDRRGQFCHVGSPCCDQVGETRQALPPRNQHLHVTSMKRPMLASNLLVLGQHHGQLSSMDSHGADSCCISSTHPSYHCDWPVVGSSHSGLASHGGLGHFGGSRWGCVRGEGDTHGAVTGGGHSGAGGWCVWGGRSVGQEARPIGPGHAVSVGWVSVGWVSVGWVPMGVGVHGVSVCGAEGLWDRRPSLWDQDSLCPWGGWLWGLWGRRPSLWGQDTLCPWGGCL